MFLFRPSVREICGAWEACGIFTGRLIHWAIQEDCDLLWTNVVQDLHVPFWGEMGSRVVESTGDRTRRRTVSIPEWTANFLQSIEWSGMGTWPFRMLRKVKEKRWTHPSQDTGLEKRVVFYISLTSRTIEGLWGRTVALWSRANLAAFQRNLLSNLSLLPQRFALEASLR